MSNAPVTPPPPGTVFTKDPVTVTTAVFAFAQAVVAVLLIAEVFSAQVGGIIAGVITAAWAAVQLLMVKPATVPRQPLAELAYETANHTPPMASNTTVYTDPLIVTGTASVTGTTTPTEDPNHTTHIIGGPT